MEKIINETKNVVYFTRTTSYLNTVSFWKSLDSFPLFEERIRQLYSHYSRAGSIFNSKKEKFSKILRLKGY